MDLTAAGLRPDRPSAVAHAYILEGAAEQALQAAQILAESILVKLGGADQARFHAGVQTDYQIVTDQPLKIETVRTLTAGMFRRPLEGAYRIIQINAAESMRQEAQNALLKSLEEPPAYLVWILIAPNRMQLLPTIRSRARVLPILGEAEEQVFAEEETLLSLLDAAWRGEGAAVFDRPKAWDALLEHRQETGKVLADLLHDYLEWKERGVAPASALRRSAFSRWDKTVGLSSLLRAIRQVEQWRSLFQVNLNAQLAFEHLMLHWGQEVDPTPFL